MKCNKIFLLGTILLLSGSIACYSHKRPAHVENINDGFAVVELFTSEGCSSCPAAEAALAEVHEQYKRNVYVMEFHVDYWNYLGWEDMYSTKEYSMRQQRYVGIMGLSSAYTPQAIINGKSELVGSDRQKLNSLIADNLRKQAATNIKLAATVKGNDVAINYTLSGANGQALNLAIVQKNAETNVKRGENSGRKLKDINVVRVLKTIYPMQKEGTLAITLPQGLSVSDCNIIAYTQDKESLIVSGAAEAAIN